MTSLNISLPAPMRAFVKAQIAQGGYSTASEYLRALIRQDQQHKLEQLRQEIARGLEEAGRGELAPLDIEAIKARGHKRLAARTRKA